MGFSSGFSAVVCGGTARRRPGDQAACLRNPVGIGATQNVREAPTLESILKNVDISSGPPLSFMGSLSDSASGPVLHAVSCGIDPKCADMAVQKSFD